VIALALDSAVISPSPGPLPGEQVGGSHTFLTVCVITGLFASLWLVVFLLDIWQAGRRQDKRFADARELIIKATTERQDASLSPREAERLLRAISSPLEGRQDLIKGLLAPLAMTLFAFALISSFVSTSADSIDLRKTLTGGLLSIMSVIVGYFFGTTRKESDPGPASPGQAPSDRPRPE
jgi:hypothetical protein